MIVVAWAQIRRASVVEVGHPTGRSAACAARPPSSTRSQRPGRFSSGLDRDAHDPRRPGRGAARLKLVQHSATKAGTHALNQLHALVLTAPGVLPARLRGRNGRALLATCAGFRIRSAGRFPAIDGATVDV
jgi:hypothetical protein